MEAMKKQIADLTALLKAKPPEVAKRKGGRPRKVVAEPQPEAPT